MASCCYECCRKPWYKRAMEISSLWKSISWSSPTNLNTTISRSAEVNYPTTTTTTTTLANPNRSSSSTSNSNNYNKKLTKCASLRVASSFTRVFLCAPISSYNEVLRADIPPRRSNSYPRSSSSSSKSSFSTQERFSSARLSTEGKRVIFRGKSLMDDVLMRRFVVEEEAMIQIRRRNQMEVIRRRRRNLMTRKKIGPSPLSRMVMAKAVEDEHYFN